MPDDTVKAQILKLRSLGICDMMDLEKVEYFAEALKLHELVQLVRSQKTNYRMFVMCS